MNADLFSVQNRVVCVTGASQGLGQRAATILSEKGAKVVGVARRENALKDWCNSGENRAYVAADISKRENLDAIVTDISSHFGAVDILINAAGLNPRELAEDVTPEKWDLTLALNLSAPFFLAQKCVASMKAKQWGRIINFASLQSQRAFPAGIAYGATKGGVAQLTRAMAES